MAACAPSAMPLATPPRRWTTTWSDTRTWRGLRTMRSPRTRPTCAAAVRSRAASRRGDGNDRRNPDALRNVRIRPALADVLARRVRRDRRETDDPGNLRADPSDRASVEPLHVHRL